MEPGSASPGGRTLTQTSTLAPGGLGCLCLSSFAHAPGTDIRLRAPGEQMKEEGSCGAPELRRGATEALAELSCMGSPHPHGPRPACNRLMSSHAHRNRKGLLSEPVAVRQPGLGRESGFPLVKATGSEGRGTARAPNVFPNDWKQDVATGPTPGHNNIPSADAINGNVFLEGPDVSGLFRSDPSSDKNTDGI